MAGVVYDQHKAAQTLQAALVSLQHQVQEHEQHLTRLHRDCAEIWNELRELTETECVREIHERKMGTLLGRLRWLLFGR